MIHDDPILEPAAEPAPEQGDHDRPSTRDIPVIFLTAKAEVEDEAKGLELGAAEAEVEGAALLVRQDDAARDVASATVMGAVAGSDLFALAEGAVGEDALHHQPPQPGPAGGRRRIRPRRCCRHPRARAVPPATRFAA